MGVRRGRAAGAGGHVRRAHSPSRGVGFARGAGFCVSVSIGGGHVARALVHVGRGRRWAPRARRLGRETGANAGPGPRALCGCAGQLRARAHGRAHRRGRGEHFSCTHTRTHAHYCGFTRTHARARARAHGRAHPRGRGEQVFTWGEGSCGRCGHGGTEAVFTPTRVRGAMHSVRMSQVSCGTFHTLALSEKVCTTLTRICCIQRSTGRAGAACAPAVEA